MEAFGASFIIIGEILSNWKCNWRQNVVSRQSSLGCRLTVVTKWVQITKDSKKVAKAVHNAYSAIIVGTKARF